MRRNNGLFRIEADGKIDADGASRYEVAQSSDSDPVAILVCIELVKDAEGRNPTYVQFSLSPDDATQLGLDLTAHGAQGLKRLLALGPVN